MFNFLRRFYTYRNSIHFIYAEKYSDYGSTVMRGQQLSKIAQKAYNEPIHSTSTAFGYKNCILFLNKWAIYTITEKQFKKLKRRKNVLIFDMIDGELPSIKTKYADILVAPSQTILETYKKTPFKNKDMFLVDHHADLRIRQLKKQRRLKNIEVGYFGEIPNTVFTPEIQKVVDFFPVATTYQNNDWFKELSKYNLHYAIRQKRDVFPNKPFLKGFTAAHCNANILIQDSEKEAVRWLGKDYPYLLKGKVTERKILNMISKIKKSYGSKEWKRGLKIMQRIKKQTSEKAIGKQVVELFNYCQNL